MKEESQNLISDKGNGWDGMGWDGKMLSVFTITHREIQSVMLSVGGPQWVELCLEAADKPLLSDRARTLINGGGEEEENGDNWRGVIEEEEEESKSKPLQPPPPA